MPDARLPPLGELRELVSMLRSEGVTDFSLGELSMRISPPAPPDPSTMWDGEPERPQEQASAADSAKATRQELRHRLFSGLDDDDGGDA